MWKYLGRRVFQIIITLLLFQATTFFLLEAQPGDVADLLTANPSIPPSEGQRLRQTLGLDRPVGERFVLYITNFYRGNLGVSFTEYPRPVTDIIAERLPRTLVLFLTATVVSFWAGYGSGKVIAWRRGSALEYMSTVGGVILYTVFTPWFALMMIWMFAVQLDWFPAGKFLDARNLEWITTDIDANTLFMRMIWTSLIASVVAVLGIVVSRKVEPRWRTPVRIVAWLVPLLGLTAYWYFNQYGSLVLDIVHHMVLPVLTVTLIAYGGTMLLMRTSMLETLREDYIQTARAKGLSDRVIRDKHAARNALLPVWTGLVFALGNSVAGGIVTEQIFSWKGVGKTLLDATINNDIPLAMGVLTILGVMTLISHLIADIGYVFLDPRIRFSDH